MTPRIYLDENTFIETRSRPLDPVIDPTQGTLVYRGSSPYRPVDPEAHSNPVKETIAKLYHRRALPTVRIDPATMPRVPTYGPAPHLAPRRPTNPYYRTPTNR